MCRPFGSPEIEIFEFLGNVVLKLPLLFFLPTVIGLPPYGNSLGRLTLFSLVAVRLLELGGPLGLPELG